MVRVPAIRLHDGVLTHHSLPLCRGVAGGGELVAVSVYLLPLPGEGLVAMTQSQ